MFWSERERVSLRIFGCFDQNIVLVLLVLANPKP